MNRYITPLLTLAFLLCSAAVSAQEFIFVYPEIDDNTDLGFDDPTSVVSDITGAPTTLGEERRVCFEAAADVWSKYLRITVPVEVEAVFSNQGGSQFGAPLAFAGPLAVFSDFANAPVGSMWFTSAQANQFRGDDLDDEVGDIQADFNADVDLPSVLGSVSWYYGLDGNAGDDIDFFGVAMHELGHGLGFLSLVSDSGGLLAGIPDIYSALLQDTDITPKEFVLMTQAQRQLAITGGNLTWAGPAVESERGGSVAMYAPSPVQPGSSTSHWDTSLTPNELMEPFATDPFTDLGLEVAAFTDMLWPLESGTAAPPIVERNFFFRALPAESDEGDPVVSLSWIDPDLLNYNKALLVRSVTDYPRSPTEGAVIFNARDSSFLDTNVLDGTRYYYTLFIQFTTGVTQASFATVVAGSDAPVVLSEPFAPAGSGGVGDPFDLNFSQITFTPVGAAVDSLDREIGYAGYDAYEASVTTDIRDFPVLREDSNGGSFDLPLSNDGTFGYTFGSDRFPFFGRDYAQVFIHANGFISFNRVNSGDALGVPGVVEHFAIPRISGLFSDLVPNNGGQVWVRQLNDRVAVTFENVPGTTGGTIFTPPPGNSFQMELFFSGQIRITYKNIGVTESFVGISDGRGVPQRPEELFPGVTSTLSLVDFSELGPAPTRLHIQSIPPVVVNEGERVQLTVEAVFNPAFGVPQLDAEWTGEGSPPFGDNGNGTGVFQWSTTDADIGVTTLRISARQGSARAYQDVRIIVNQVVIPPEATDLLISTGAPNEDPAESRIVSSDRPLTASYNYFHPKFDTDPASYAEGPSFIRWFRNGETIPSLWGVLNVPASATRAGDVWHFRIIPLTKEFIAGEEAISPFVTIVDLPVIEAVTPSVGLTTGGEKVRIFGSRLSSPLSVTFGGTAAVGVRVISDRELEVTSPLRNVGLVTVAVRTVQGTGSLPAAFRYVNSLDDLPKEDVNVDGKVDAIDIQIVAGAVLGSKDAIKATSSPDVNGDGVVNAADVQLVVNRALLR